ELDRAEDPEADERVAEAAAELRQHRERHVDLHPEDLAARHEVLAEELLPLRRRDELRRAFDEEDLLLLRPGAEEEHPRLALERELEEVRGERRAIDLHARA